MDIVDFRRMSPGAQLDFLFSEIERLSRESGSALRKCAKHRQEIDDLVELATTRKAVVGKYRPGGKKG